MATGRAPYAVQIIGARTATASVYVIPIMVFATMALRVMAFAIFVILATLVLCAIENVVVGMEHVLAGLKEMDSVSKSSHAVAYFTDRYVNSLALARTASVTTLFSVTGDVPRLALQWKQRALLSMAVMKTIMVD